MKPWEAKYTGDQWRAIYDARFAKDLTYARIADLAADGTLTGEPFEIGAMYIGEKCRAEKKRRAGKHKRPIADLATKDSNEFMRASLLNLWDTERVELERQKPGKRDLARLEQLAKLSITIARIPGQKDLAPKNPATRNQDGRREPQLVGGTAGDLINAMRATTPREDETAEPEHEDARTGEDDAASSGLGSLTHASAKPLAA
jgi:hypothetical protein